MKRDTTSPFPRAVDTHEIHNVIGPRLFLVSQVLWSAASDRSGDLCPWEDDDRRHDFLLGLANTVDDILEVLEQSFERRAAEEA